MMKSKIFVSIALAVFMSTINVQAQSKITDPIFEFFHTKIRPYMMDGYKAYYDNVGVHVDAGTLAAYDAMSPHVRHIYQNNVAFWYAKNPEMFEDFNNVPTPLKIAHEKFLFGLWGVLQKYKTEEITKVNAKFTNATNMIFAANLVRTGKVRAPREEQQRLERLLNEIRNFAPDKEMRSCFKVYAVPSDIINAFNTGCNIFVNSGLYKIMNDDQVRGVISHEITHGSRGHGLKSFGHIATTVVSHTFKVNMEGLNWILTDEEMDYLKETFERGHGEMIIDGVGSRAPVLEIEADQGGARLLNAAGYSAQPLIDSLIQLHKVKEEYLKKNPQPPQKNVRKYPGLEVRINAIKSVMEF